MFGFVYGLIMFFREPSALYARMIVLGMGCIMLGCLFETLQLVHIYSGCTAASQKHEMGKTGLGQNRVRAKQG